MVTSSVGRFQSSRISEFKESVIREMTRLAFQHGAVNLAQGFPDFPAPSELKAAAQKAIGEAINQYSITWGLKAFREAICDYYRQFYAIDLDPEREVTVCCGATEGMIASLLALLNPGDEVVVFEPFYENYWPDSQLSGAVCRYVRLRPLEWTLDPNELRAAFTERTRAVILNSPNNPTGHVFLPNELRLLAELCEQYDCLLITDEIYEHIVFDGERHVPPITLPGMRERCVLVNSLSKTYSVTGWRLKLPLEYYGELARHYETKRSLLTGILEEVGFRCFTPKGAYYIMCDISGLGFPNDVALARYLVEDIGVAAVPGSSFFSQPAYGAHLIRFCFAKKPETLEAAGERLRRLRA